MTGGLFRDGDFVMSYPRLSDQAAAVAAALVELGVSDDRVLVMLPEGPGFVHAFVGAMQQGAVPLPVNPLLSVREIVAVTTGGRCPVGGALVDRMHQLVDPDVEPPAALVGGPQRMSAVALRLR